MPSSFRAAICAEQVALLSTAEIQAMDRTELLEAIWAAESEYRQPRIDPAHDHRRCLDRAELEHVLQLVQHALHRRSTHRRSVR